MRSGNLEFGISVIQNDIMLHLPEFYKGIKKYIFFLGEKRFLHWISAYKENYAINGAEVMLCSNTSLPLPS